MTVVIDLCQKYPHQSQTCQVEAKDHFLLKAIQSVKICLFHYVSTNINKGTVTWKFFSQEILIKIRQFFLMILLLRFTLIITEYAQAISLNTSG